MSHRSIFLVFTEQRYGWVKVTCLSVWSIAAVCENLQYYFLYNSLAGCQASLGFPHHCPTLPASLPPCLPASLPPCLHASLPPCLPPSLLPSLPPSLPPFLPPSHETAEQGVDASELGLDRERSELADIETSEDASATEYEEGVSLERHERSGRGLCAVCWTYPLLVKVFAECNLSRLCSTVLFVNRVNLHQTCSSFLGITSPVTQSFQLILILHASHRVSELLFSSC